MSGLVVISPHLDDAVFSCGTLLAAHALDPLPPVVVTVCAGVPTPEEGVPTLTQLDAAAGFASSAEAVRQRRLEDIEACGTVGALVAHLGVLDAQYAVGMGTEERRVTMRDALKNNFHLFEGATVLAPVGIRHADHKDVARVCLGLASWRYAELPYRVMDGAAKLETPPTLALPWSEVKDRAVRCYRSQLGDGPPGPELLAEERYWPERWTHG